MKVTFVGANPRERAEPLIGKILERGVDQVAIACAFLTGGGAELLRVHGSYLKLPDSFLVVAWESPTDLVAIESVHKLFPGNVYVHLGAQTPVEKGVGAGLMHSKVFLSRAGSQCWMWTGSHNLTASAAQGVNCEAAVVLEGKADEEPFRDALVHLNQCKNEAIVFNPYQLPPVPPPEQTLIIHAECHESLKVLPWFVHLRPATTDYDRVMRPPASVWLYLYKPNSLHPGYLRPQAQSAYSGTLTALNFTQYHPRRGIPADWREADFVIEQTNGIFRLTDPKPLTKVIPTQSIFRIDAEEDPSTVWLTGSPTPKIERVVGEEWTKEVDPEYRKFFTPQSLAGGQLVHREYRSILPTYDVPRREIGNIEQPALALRLKLPEDTRIQIVEPLPEDRFAFIYKAKYRI